jgi:UDP-2-acetamido-2-deoxy-ribo-hexuluronate aminotransferase
MEQIHMVDLKSQYLKIKKRVDDAIFSVIDTTAFIKGKQVGEFENKLAEYLDVSHAVSCANGTDALQIALMALDLKPGDEVITPSFTFVATAEVIALMGLKPVFVEVDPHTFTISADDIERKITRRTKAIVPVHLFGQGADMDEIMHLAERHRLFVIEDNAQAIGGEFLMRNGERKKLGTIGHIGTTSFFPSKNLGCYGDGGALFTNDDALAEKIRLIANHGMKIRYQYDSIGINSRLDTIQAAILKVKLEYLDEYLAARQKAADHYDQAFGTCKLLSIPKRNDSSTHVFHQYTLTLHQGENQALVGYLKTKGIPAMIYYPYPVHTQPAYKQFGCKAGSLPVTEDLCKRVISLPMHTELSAEQQDFIIESVLTYINS